MEGYDIVVLYLPKIASRDLQLPEMIKLLSSDTHVFVRGVLASAINLEIPDHIQAASEAWAENNVVIIDVLDPSEGLDDNPRILELDMRESRTIAPILRNVCETRKVPHDRSVETAEGNAEVEERSI